MKKFSPFFVLLLFVAVLSSSCKKDRVDNPWDEQLKKDEQLIKDFLIANNITAQRHESGVYYVISDPGAGTGNYTAATTVEVKYSLRLLGGSDIPQPTEPVALTLGNVILGWQIGVPLIRKGGKIRLFVPSIYAYGAAGRPNIPANSVLDFDIELLDVTY